MTQTSSRVGASLKKWGLIALRGTAMNGGKGYQRKKESGFTLNGAAPTNPSSERSGS
ncbi:MAG: hypothetical protein ACREHG_00640 [Candidatus Saccharimonadales bacterium]